MTEQRNWAGNYVYQAARLHRPETVVQVQTLMRQSHRVKALGSRHSFSDIADTAADLVSLEILNRVVSLDREQRTVTVEGGIRYGALCDYLNREGYALHNLASLPHISVAGACATATHGSGDGNGNLATAVVALELITADGEIKSLLRGRDEAFAGAVVSLGALGIVTRMTLAVEPTFQVRQDVYENLPVATLEENFDTITSSAYSVSLFTDWQRDFFNQVWRKSRIDSESALPLEDTFFGATRATRALHPIARLSAANCTEQGGVPGPWHERLPHFRMEYTPSNGEELQTEYLIPREVALQALRSVSEMREALASLLLISEVRTIAADTLWLSPCYQQPCVGIHFTWKRDWPAVNRLLPELEARLAPYRARPHWGKLFSTAPEQLAALYPRWQDFQQLRQKVDPEGKFGNAFLDRSKL